MSKESVFSVKSILNFSWECVRTKFFELIGHIIWATLLIGVVAFVITLVFGGIGTLVSGGNPIVIGIFGFLGALVIGGVSIAVSFGFIKNFLNLCRGDKTDLWAFARVKPMTLVFFIIASVLCSIAVGIGLILLILPGLILLYLLMYVPYLIIDRDMGPIAAIKESIKIAGGKRRSEIFVGIFVSFVIVNFFNGLSFFALTIIALPMFFFMWVYPYMVLTGDLEKVRKNLLGTADTATVPAATAATAAEEAVSMEDTAVVETNA